MTESPEARPRLVAVEGGAGGPEAAPTAERGGRLRAARPGLRGVLCVGARAGGAPPALRAEQLAESVGALEAELEGARAVIEAHQAHLGAVRGAVGSLEAQLAALREIVDRDPRAVVVEAEPEAPPAP